MKNKERLTEKEMLETCVRFGEIAMRHGNGNLSESILQSRRLSQAQSMLMIVNQYAEQRAREAEIKLMEKFCDNLNYNYEDIQSMKLFYLKEIKALKEKLKNES